MSEAPGTVAGMNETHVALADFEGLKPVILVTHDTSFSIIYSPGGPEYRQQEAVLEANGVEGSGYDFSGALQAALADSDPGAAGKVGFDPEAGMVSVYGPDLDALLVAARQLHRLVTDPGALDAALKRAVELGFDD
jgi:hypothetical protein